MLNLVVCIKWALGFGGLMDCSLKRALGWSVHRWVPLKYRADWLRIWIVFKERWRPERGTNSQLLKGSGPWEFRTAMLKPRRESPLMGPWTPKLIQRTGFGWGESVWDAWWTVFFRVRRFFPLSLLLHHYSVFIHSSPTLYNLGKVEQGAWGCVVVKALCCQSEGFGIDPQCCHWGFFRNYRRNHVHWGRLSL